MDKWIDDRQRERKEVNKKAYDERVKKQADDDGGGRRVVVPG